MARNPAIKELSRIEFTGRLSVPISDYSKKSKKLARDFASELETAGQEAEAACRLLRGHPLLAGLDIRVRAYWVRRRFNRCRELAEGLAIEAHKIKLEYEKQFLQALESGKHRRKSQVEP